MGSQAAGGTIQTPWFTCRCLHFWKWRRKCSLKRAAKTFKSLSSSYLGAKEDEGCVVSWHREVCAYRALTHSLVADRSNLLYSRINEPKPRERVSQNPKGEVGTEALTVLNQLELDYASYFHVSANVGAMELTTSAEVHNTNIKAY